jgi:hypothetical protein
MKNYFVKTAIITSVMIPLLVGAQTGAPSTQPSTVCAQASIEKRDTAIAAARTVYGASMTAALTARKEAEKVAVAIDDKDAKKDAIKNAVTAYKTAAKSAQETLTTARRLAWATFEAETKDCRGSQEDTASAQQEDPRSRSELRRGEGREGREEGGARSEMNRPQNLTDLTPEERRSEIQKIRDSFKSQMQNLRSFFN